MSDLPPLLAPAGVQGERESGSAPESEAPAPAAMVVQATLPPPPEEDPHELEELDAELMHLQAQYQKRLLALTNKRQSVANLLARRSSTDIELARSVSPLAPPLESSASLPPAARVAPMRQRSGLPTTLPPVVCSSTLPVGVCECVSLLPCVCVCVCMLLVFSQIFHSRPTVLVIVPLYLSTCACLAPSLFPYAPSSSSSSSSSILAHPSPPFTLNHAHSLRLFTWWCYHPHPLHWTWHHHCLQL
jgi:hypothetical protein